MQQISSVQPETAQGATRELFQTVQQAFGMIPNATKVMGHSPAVLESFLVFSQAMGKAQIGPKLHTQIKLAVSESNDCLYCTSILSAVGPSVGLTPTEILQSRARSAEENRTKAALNFAYAVLENHGKIDPEDLQSVRDAGFTDAELVEIIASVVLGCFTNFLNNVIDTTLDFPEAPSLVIV